MVDVVQCAGVLACCAACHGIGLLLCCLLHRFLIAVVPTTASLTALPLPGAVCRGKLLNVRDAGAAQITGNAEIQNIKQILGLQHGKVYSDAKSLRYGHLMIMTDQVGSQRGLAGSSMRGCSCGARLVQCYAGRVHG